jgi:hypothetical protein
VEIDAFYNNPQLSRVIVWLNYHERVLELITDNCSDLKAKEIKKLIIEAPNGKFLKSVTQPKILDDFFYKVCMHFLTNRTTFLLFSLFLCL